MSLESITENVDEAVSGFFEPIAKWLGEIVFYAVPVGGTDLPLIVAWLVVAGLVFTGWFGFVQVRKFRLAIDVVRGKYDDKDSAGEVNHFQALTAAVSGTVGLGNIAGVAVAVSIGGAGATFWMILCGLLGMATKFVEVTLGVKYREVHADGTVSGGPMHYLPKGLAERFGKNGRTFGKVLAVLASIMILFFGLFGGNLFQVNQSYAQLVSVTGGEDGAMGSSAGALFFGILVAALVGIVLLGGIRSIASVTNAAHPRDGRDLHRRLPRRHPRQRHRRARRDRHDHRGRLQPRRRRGRCTGRTDHRLPACRVLQRGLPAPRRSPTPRSRPSTRPARAWSPCWSRSSTRSSSAP